MIVNNKFILPNPLAWCLNKSVGYVFIFFSLLPWVNFGLNSRDSQPWALLFGSIFLLTSFKNTFYKQDIFIFLLPLIAMLVWLLFSRNILDFIALRALINYSTISICLFAFLIFFRKYEFPMGLFIGINIIYLVVGVIQLYIPDIVSSIVISRGAGLSGRGVTSLAPEPTFFGIFLFFISFIFLVQSEFKPSYKISILIFLNIIAIILLSKSSTVLLFVLLSIPVILATRLRLITLILLILLSTVMAFILYYFLEDSRMMILYELLREQGIAKLIFIDASVNDRVANVVYPIHGFYLNNFLPSGFHSFTEIHSYLNDYYLGFFNYGSGSTSILSYLGAFLYELGFMGLFFLIWIFIRMQNGTFSTFTDCILFFILLNSSIPPSFPLIPLIIALFILNNENSKSLNNA
ncbi:hypothetical protein N9I03_00360 [Gammaproteobacteria bacterium]|nr:hypothetical protein [Gammaproteobacteria bacterium]